MQMSEMNKQMIAMALRMYQIWKHGEASDDPWFENVNNRQERNFKETYIKYLFQMKSDSLVHWTNEQRDFLSSISIPSSIDLTLDKTINVVKSMILLHPHLKKVFSSFDEQLYKHWHSITMSRSHYLSHK